VRAEVAAAVRSATPAELQDTLGTLSGHSFEVVAAAVGREQHEAKALEMQSSVTSDCDKTWVVVDEVATAREVAAQDVAAPKCKAWSTVPTLTPEITMELPAIGLDRSVVNAVLSVVAPAVDQTRRAPLQLVVVLDSSTSMGLRGRWELVVQSMLLLLRHLSDLDKLGIIIFDSNAHVLAPLTACDSEGRADLEEALSRVRLRGGTNLSGGLYRALELHACACANQSCADRAGVVR